MLSRWHGETKGNPTNGGTLNMQNGKNDVAYTVLGGMMVFFFTLAALFGAVLLLALAAHLGWNLV